MTMQSERNGLIADLEEFRRLRTLPNVFLIMDNVGREETHARLLRWLLDPRESHGLGHAFGEQFFSDIPASAHRVHWPSIRVEMEKRLDKKSRPDLIVKSDDATVLWVLELKTLSQDHHGQLGRYRDWAKREFAEAQRFYVYITPYGDKPKQQEERCHWTLSSYQRVLDILDIVAGLSVDDNPARRVLTDYSDAVRRRFYLGSQSQNKGEDILGRFAGETTAELLQAYPEVLEIYKDEFESLKRLEARRARMQRAA